MYTFSLKISTVFKGFEINVNHKKSRDINTRNERPSIQITVCPSLMHLLHASSKSMLIIVCIRSRYAFFFNSKTSTGKFRGLSYEPAQPRPESSPRFGLWYAHTVSMKELQEEQEINRKAKKFMYS